MISLDGTKVNFEFCGRTYEVFALQTWVDQLIVLGDSGVFIRALADRGVFPSVPTNFEVDQENLPIRQSGLFPDAWRLLVENMGAVVATPVSSATETKISLQ